MPVWIDKRDVRLVAKWVWRHNRKAKSWAFSEEEVASRIIDEAKKAIEGGFVFHTLCVSTGMFALSPVWNEKQELVRIMVWFSPYSEEDEDPVDLTED